MNGCCAPGKGPRSAPEPLGLTLGAGADGGAQRKARVDTAIDLITIPAGTFTMGYEGPLANPGEGEGPARQVTVPAFEISAGTVTNAQFELFADATGYVTEAEQCGWSFVFYALVRDAADVRGRVHGAEWWCAVDGATWRTPFGRQGGPALDDHPVVHLSAFDAEAFCAWAGYRLPGEAEWERAARGGLENALFPWGDDEPSMDFPARCNIWYGEFPTRHDGGQEAIGTRPSISTAPNGFGVHHAVGNVWEWTADTWHDPFELAGEPHRVRRGGSYLCHDSYCNRYRVAARDHSQPQDTTGNLGFRVARSLPAASSTAATSAAAAAPTE